MYFYVMLSILLAWETGSVSGSDICSPRCTSKERCIDAKCVPTCNAKRDCMLASLSYKQCCDKLCSLRENCDGSCTLKSDCVSNEYCVGNKCAKNLPHNYCDGLQRRCPSDKKCKDNRCITKCQCASDEECNVFGDCRKKSSVGFSTAEIVGIVIGGIVSTCVFIAFIVIFIRHGNRTGWQSYNHKYWNRNRHHQQTNLHITTVTIQGAGQSSFPQTIVPSQGTSLSSFPQSTLGPVPSAPMHHDAGFSHSFNTIEIHHGLGMTPGAMTSGPSFGTHDMNHFDDFSCRSYNDAIGCGSDHGNNFCSNDTSHGFTGSNFSSGFDHNN